MLVQPKLGWVVTLVVLAVGSSFGQTGDDRWNRLRELRAGEKIQVIDLSFKKLKGKFVRISDEAVLLKASGKEISVPRSNVMLISLPRTKTRSIFMTAIMGALLGATLWVEADRAARGCYDYGDYVGSCDKRRGLSPRSAAVFAGAGAGSMGILAAFSRDAGKVLYIHDPRQVSESDVEDRPAQETKAREAESGKSLPSAASPEKEKPRGNEFLPDPL